MHFQDITAGDRFGRLIVLHEDPDDSPERRFHWICRCDCGAITSVIRYSLARGGTQSCGCLRWDRLRDAVATHGLSHKIPEYGAWKRMRQRCNDPHVSEYARYGGRGIRICVEWEAFEQFLTDMGRRPSNKHTLERIDNDRGYSAENCRWATRQEQARNFSSNHLLTFQGQTLSMAAWADRVTIPYSTIRSRLRVGWSVERALTHPVRPIHHRT